jgi:hypothetical protein
MKCTECGGAGEVPAVYTSQRKRERGQLALAWQRCLLCAGKGTRERVEHPAMRAGRVVVRERKAVRDAR